MSIIKGIDLDLKSFETFSMLIHGDYNTFKTFLTGSFIASLLKVGKKALFWHIQGEDNLRTLGFFPEIEPKKHIWTLQTYQDIEEAMEELAKNPVDGLGIDSGKLWADKVMLKFTDGVDRPLRVPKGRGDSSQEWPLMHHKMERMLQAIRQCAKQVIMTCPSDLSAHHLDPNTDTWTKAKRVTPNFPGNEASRSTGWFDFVGYCEGVPITQGVRRILNFQYSNLFSSRASIVRQFDEGIKLLTVEKDGHLVWESVVKAIEGRM